MRATISCVMWMDAGLRERACVSARLATIACAAMFLLLGPATRAHAGPPPDWSRSIEAGGAWNYGRTSRANASDTLTTHLGWGPGAMARLRADASSGWGYYAGARYAEARIRYEPTSDTLIARVSNVLEPVTAVDRALALTVGGLNRIFWRDFALESSLGAGWAVAQCERRGTISGEGAALTVGLPALEASVGVTARLTSIWWIGVGASVLYTGLGADRARLVAPTLWPSGWVSLRWQFNGPVEVPETGSRLAR